MDCAVEDWLIKPIMLVGVPLQNWMIVTFTLMLIAALINVSERR